MKKSWFIVIGMLFIFSTLVLAAKEQPYHLKLLAVQENGDGYQGSDADLYLELKEGSGRVFLETFPLTKLDTQISTRFAKDIACNHFKLDCENYDFIYTIKAKSTIIGGPSAGAAIAALTTIAVLDLDYNEKATITGTINSGGIIGPVGGVKEKLEAASAAGLTTVMIPLGTAKQKLQEKEINSTSKSLPEINPHNQTKITPGNYTANGTNATTNTSINNSDLVSYGQEKLNLHVIEVIDLDTAVKELTGVDLNHKPVIITESEAYARIMKGLQDALCIRGDNLMAELNQEHFLLDNASLTLYESRKEAAENATRQNDYYSAASYCFSNDILLRTNFYKQQNLSKVQLMGLYVVLKDKTAKLNEKVKNESIETISDLQTRMVVQERLQDVEDQLQRIRGTKDPLSLEEMGSLLAYGEERFYSAVAWFQFFSMDGKEFVFDNSSIAQSCMKKIAESEERHQYAALFLGPQISFIEEKIMKARKAFDNNDFTLCLITAAQAKADANAIISSLGIEESSFSQYLESKQKIAERMISENSADGVFPILGYSYYKYALSLQEKEKFNALVYLEYALEMSDLSMYFPEKKSVVDQIQSSFLGKRDFRLQMEGFMAGVFVVLILLALRGKKKKR